MNHFRNTPEALLGRSDSKNPATTCRGITSSGRPCRRALAFSKSSSPLRRAFDPEGVVALVEVNGQLTDAQFYCWQHKEQAGQVSGGAEEDEQPAGKPPRTKHTEVLELKNRSSIDTLVQRLGIHTAVENASRAAVGKSSNNAQQQRPQLKTAGERLASSRTGSYGDDRRDKLNGYVPSRRNVRKARSIWEDMCCMLGVEEDDDYVEVVRHRRRVENDVSPAFAAMPTSRVNTWPAKVSSGKASMTEKTSVARSEPRQNLQHATSSNSKTGRLLSFIRPQTSPQIASALLTELSKAPNQNDEDGYIYIFWLTPSSISAPTESTAKSLLSPGHARLQQGRKLSDVMTEYSYSGTDRKSSSKTKPKTIMLKIGRANNVTRRMNEWQRQCGYALNLVRWYPYVPSSGAGSPQASPSRLSNQQPLYPDLSQYGRPPTSRRQTEGVRKVPCVKRVERLIHLELADDQVKRQCAACGREHREWFEVEASECGIRAVDEVVRRWVGWSEIELSS